MSDLDALYRAILDRPDDDTPRLVYADALDDLGLADQAAFIRGQVEAARAAPWEPAAVIARVVADDAAPVGLAELPDGLAWDRHPFRRGFPAVVHSRDGAAFVAAADRLFDLAPVESLELETTPAGDVAALAACPGLARLKRLVIRAGLGQATARLLLNAPHLGGLEELEIGAWLTSASTAAAVVGSRAFRGLRSFSYRDETQGARGGSLVTTLADLTDPPPLRSLDVQGCRLTPEAVRRLIRSPLARGLVALDIGDNHIGQDGFREFDAGVLPRLARLDATRTGPGANGVGALLHAPFFHNLRWLNLGGNALPPVARDASGTTALRHLRVLDLCDNRLGDTGVGQLASTPFDQILHLDLSGNGIGAAGADALAEAPGLEGIIALDLSGNLIPEPARDRLRDRFGDRVLL